MASGTGHPADATWKRAEPACDPDWPNAAAGEGRGSRSARSSIHRRSGPSRGSVHPSGPATASSASSLCPDRATRTRSPKRTSAAHDASPRAWASRSRTRACSTRRSGSLPRPSSAAPSSRSSTRSAPRSPSSSTSQAIIELVGERLATMFRSTDMYVAMYDRITKPITFPYELDHGERVYGDPIQLGQGLSSQILRSGRSMRFGTSEDRTAHGAGRRQPTPVDAAKHEQIVVGRSASVGRGDDRPRRVRERRARELLQRGGRTARRRRRVEHGRRARERPAVRRDEAPPRRDQRARRRAGDHQQRPAGPRGEPRHAGDVRPRRRQDRARSSMRRSVDIGLYDLDDGTVALPVRASSGGSASDDIAIPIGALSGRIVARDARAARRQRRRRVGGASAAIEGPVARAAKPPKSVLFAPLVVGDEVRGRISLQNLDRDGRVQRGGRAPADDARLEPERRARERAAGRRDAPARRRAGDRQRASARRPRRSSTSTR